MAGGVKLNARSSQIQIILMFNSHQPFLSMGDCRTSGLTFLVFFSGFKFKI